MVVRAAALQSALAGMTAAHMEAASAAQSLAKPLFAPPSQFVAPSRVETAEAQSAAESMSADVGGSLISLNRSLTLSRSSSETAGAAQAMLDELLEVSRQP